MALQQGLSGLNATSKNLEIIGNNIANANTVGFKASRAEFSDMYAAALNGAGTNAIGIGVNLSSVAQQFTQGSIRVTENPLDLAVNGDGFFALKNNLGERVYSRNGQFKVDSEGYIVNNAGSKLLGADGMPLLVPSGARNPPLPTTTIEGQFNLKADADVNTVPFSTDKIKSFVHATSVTIYTQNGTAQALTLYFRKDAANEWTVYGYRDNRPLKEDGPIATLKFKADGTLDKIEPDEVTVEGLKFDFGGTTQFASPFGVSKLQPDGRAEGVMTSFVVGQDGVLSARFSNGQTDPVGRVGLAKFANPNGLQPMGDNVWAWTPEAGPQGTLLPPGTDRLGVLQAGALEDSNVDLTAELVNMITAQRMYQANAQTIKTMDQAMQSIVNLR